MTLISDIRASAAHGRAFMAAGMFIGAFAAYAPGLKSQAGLGDADFGLALLVGSFGAIGAMILAPRVEALLGARSMGICAIAMALGFLLPGLAAGWGGFALALLVAFGAAGLLDVVMNARLSVFEARRGLSLMNLNHGLFSIAYGLAALGAGLARDMGVPPVWTFAALGGLTLLLVQGMNDPQPLRKEASEGETDAARMRLPVLTITLAGLVVLISFTAEQATENWSALHLERAFGANPAEGALGPAILGLTMGFGRLCGQGAVQHIREGKLMQIAAALAASGLILAAYAPLQGLAYAGFAVLGLGVSVIGPTALAWIGRSVPDEMRSLAVSRMVMIGYCGFFVGPPVIGLMAELFGLRLALAMMGGLLLCISAILVPALRASARVHHPPLPGRMDAQG